MGWTESISLSPRLALDLLELGGSNLRSSSKLFRVPGCNLCDLGSSLSEKQRRFAFIPRFDMGFDEFLTIK